MHRTAQGCALSHPVQGTGETEMISSPAGLRQHMERLTEKVQRIKLLLRFKRTIRVYDPREKVEGVSRTVVAEAKVF